MNRRNLLQSVASVVAGAGIIGADPDATWGATATSEPPTPASNPPNHFIEIRDGVSLFYKEWGTGTPVLFVNSWGMTTQLWQYQMVDLCSRGFRCIAYDQRGHGRSSDPGCGFEYDTFADDLAQVIEKLDLHNITLVGHSVGCGVIARYVTRHGASRVSRVVMIAPTLPFMLKTPDNPNGVDESQLEQLRAIWKKDLPKWFGDNARSFFVAETPQAMLDWAVTMGLQASLKALVDFNHSATQADFREELTKFNIPTLIIHGAADTSALLDFTGRRTAKLIPNCQLKVYEGAPHGLMFTHIERLNADLLAFLKA
jgi:non-heme chloroperoxidase